MKDLFETRVARRMINIDVSAGDFAAMVGDTQDEDLHAAMLAALVRILPSWESLDIDWPKHICDVIARMSKRDVELFRTFLLNAYEALPDKVDETMWEGKYGYELNAAGTLLALQERIFKLKIALADAVRRPMGVHPDSMQGLITQEEVDAAEERRPKHS
jgi:hypothetical protein